MNVSYYYPGKKNIGNQQLIWYICSNVWFKILIMIGDKVSGPSIKTF